ncbi:hypothetical protein MNBD_GAMMA22-1134 [hydrothermal vent metagenome]|uniref:Uncharacterized protein n=1 Tax=hydrothermal vent metagenome TaxID=652676 RepID=A0A3B1APF2_9ZZZZ
MMTNAKNSFGERIKLLQISFINELPSRLTEITDYSCQLDTDSNDGLALESLTRKLHSLAREVENLLKLKKLMNRHFPSNQKNKSLNLNT